MKCFSIILATRISVVASENMLRLALIKQSAVTFSAKIEGAYNPGNYPTDEQLVFKTGAQVMMVKNDKDRRRVNGSLGMVEQIYEDEITVKLESGKISFGKQRKWEQFEYSYDIETKKITERIVGTFVQFPLSLAWAITIHKSQGLTFNQVILNLEKVAPLPQDNYM